MTTKTTTMGYFDHLERENMAKAIHYPEHWDTATYPTLCDAIYEIVTNEGCSECGRKTFMEMKNEAGN